MKKLFITIIAFLFVFSTSIAQSNIAQPELDSGTIEEQFDYILTKSSKFKEFQLIRKTSLLKVKAHALDSIKNVQKKLAAIDNSTDKYESKINQLETETASLKDEIENISKDVDSISFFGSSMSKTGYNSMVWIIIAVLLLGLIILVLKIKSSSVNAKRAKNELDKIEREFESFRKKSLKKEQEIMRKLQDEINKNHP